MKPTGLLVRRLAILAMSVGLVGAVLGMACQNVEETPPANDVREPEVAPARNDAPGRDADPGIFDGEIIFGQSAAFSGPAQVLGKDMRLGIQAAFHEANQTGEFTGATCGSNPWTTPYETDYAASNTLRLIENEKVFSLIGEVGTPTSRAAARGQPSRRSVHRSVHRRRVPARSGAEQRAEPPSLVLPGD